LGCGGVTKRARNEVDRSRLAYARELLADRRSPVAFERFEKAHKAADKSPEKSVARSDYEAEERLWLETAIADAEREKLAERRLDEERALIALDQSMVALERERQSWASEAELRAAQALAINEANKALARAAERPSLRVKLPREDLKVAADALLSRCQLMALTLESVDPDNAALPKLRARLSELEASVAKDPELSLARADQTYFYVLSLFAALRGQAGAPSAEEKAALAEELASAGARPTRVDQALDATLEHAFSEGTLVPVAERVIERLCLLAKAHGRGPILVSVQAKSPAQAEGRLRLLRQRFARAGCEGQRFSFAFGKSDGDALTTSWVSY
ncbi:MAG: hypothetical protein JWN48_5978, partial [Myxococcaceae bacterium]|nr:hypothetical protein [Myxococcaceae bacterium]